MSDGTVDAASAGSHPKPLQPNAVRVMRDRGIDISGNRTKHLDEFVSQRLDMVITLCDRVREVCPEFPSAPKARALEHADPARGSHRRTARRTRRSNVLRRSSRCASRFLLADSLIHRLPNRRQRGGPRVEHETVNVRYMVDDVDEAIDFYTKVLGFELIANPAPAFADVKRGNLRLLLAGPKSSAGRPMPDGAKPGRVAGTASTSSSTTSAPKWRGCAMPAPGSAMTSSKDPAESRSCSRTPPATSSSCSNPPPADERLVIPRKRRARARMVAMFGGHARRT